MIELFGTKAIAQELGVSNAAVSNWLRRYDDTPKPAYVVHGSHSQYLWDAEGLEAWKRWNQEEWT